MKLNLILVALKIIQEWCKKIFFSSSEKRETNLKLNFKTEKFKLGLTIEKKVQ